MEGEDEVSTGAPLWGSANLLRWKQSCCKRSCTYDGQQPQCNRRHQTSPPVRNLLLKSNSAAQLANALKIYEYYFVAAGHTTILPSAYTTHHGPLGYVKTRRHPQNIKRPRSRKSIAGSDTVVIAASYHGITLILESTNIITTSG